MYFAYLFSSIGLPIDISVESGCTYVLGIQREAWINLVMLQAKPWQRPKHKCLTFLNPPKHGMRTDHVTHTYTHMFRTHVPVKATHARTSRADQQPPPLPPLTPPHVLKSSVHATLSLSLRMCAQQEIKHSHTYVRVFENKFPFRRSLVWICSGL